jgi:CRP-like cAMP-binding protein
MRKALFILSNLSDSDIDWLAATGRRERVGEASVLVQKGEPATAVYMLLDGRLSVVAENGQQLNTLLPGEIVGELSFLDSRPPTASVVTEIESVVLAIPRDKLSTKLDRDTAFAARFYRALGVFLAHRMRQLLSGAQYAESLSDEDEMADELDPAVLDSTALGARRFEFLIERVGAE